MIIGAHIMIQSIDEKADRAFLTDVLKFGSVDAGGGFMIFGVPPAEVAIHESDANGSHELYFMCDDIADFTADLAARGIAHTAPANRGWGTLTEVTLPGGGKLGVYQPHHARPSAPKAAARKKAARKTTKKATAKKPARKAPAKKKAAKKKAATRGGRR